MYEMKVAIFTIFQNTCCIKDIFFVKCFYVGHYKLIYADSIENDEPSRADWLGAIVQNEHKSAVM